MAQLTPFDFIYSIVLGGLLAQIIFNEKVTIWLGLFAVSLWGALLYVIEILSQRFDNVRLLLKGEASIIIQDGEVNIKEWKRNHLEMEQIRTILRQEGIFSFREVQDLYIEPGGKFSVKKYKKYDHVTPEMLDIQPKKESLTFMLVDDGTINSHILEDCGKTKEWLLEQLRQENYPNVKDVLYAEWSETDGFFVKGFVNNGNGRSMGN